MGRQLRPGEIFAGFRVQQRLGAGGMGDVYAVDHPRLPRRVALKLLTADTSDRGALARFEREAETIARLDHPNIVGVLDRGIEDGQPWISMQLIDGSDAGAQLRTKGPMPLHRVLRIGAEIGQALDAAHRRGVVHRDVKPANIMLTRAEHGQAERALITDFGIARLEQGPISGPEEAPTQAAADITGLVDGVRATAAFASPEQLAGDQTDGRSDQYSLACTMYCLLAGQAPYPGTAAQAIQGHLTGPVPALETVLPQVPGSVSNAIRRAMSKNPADRFTTCAEFVRSFEADVSAQARPAAGSRGGQRSRALFVGACAVALVVGGFGVWQLLGDSATVNGAVTSTTSTQTPTTTTGTAGSEEALWSDAKPVLALWPQLFPQTSAGKGYQGMVCTPNSEQVAHRPVQNRYRFVCIAREEGLDKPTVTVDLVVYEPGDAARAVEATVGSVQPLPVLAHGNKLRTYHLTDPAEGEWILVTFTAADNKDHVIQVGSKKGAMSYSQLYDWIAAAPF